MDLSEIINEFGEERERYFESIAPPIIQTSNFAFREINRFREALLEEYESYLYTRGQNPTVTILRKKLAALDEAEDALVLSSGVSATFIAVFANIRQGDHIVSVARPYSWTERLFQDILSRFGIDVTFVDGTRIENFEQALRPKTRIIYLESPNSFTFDLQDLEAVSSLAKSKQILTILDNSYCTPLYQKAIPLGIDLSIQTATKYLGGHSDVVAGVITGSKQMIRPMFNSEFLNIGAVISPLNAWLLIRSLRTLEIRLERISDTTEKVVSYFESHPKVACVLYPFSLSFPQYDLAKKQMKRSPGLFSIVLKTESMEKIETFCNSFQHFVMAVSWGGHESLIFPYCAKLRKEQFNPADPTHRTIRFYVGLEDANYLIRDIEQALAKL